MIKFRIDIPIYDQYVYVYIVDSIRDSYTNSKTLGRIIRKENSDYDGSSELDGLVLEKDRLAIIYRLGALAEKGEELISHEVFHMTKTVLYHTAVGNLTDKTEEAWAYMNGYLNGAVRKKLRLKGIPY